MLTMRPSALRRGIIRQCQRSFSITPRSKDYAQWYLDVIDNADLIDSSPVKGCMTIRPYGMAIWERLRNDLDSRIQQTGAQNAYFPIFIPQSFITREAAHVEGFAKECAVVTHHRLALTADGKSVEPDPSSQLAEPLIVRPTSETIIWATFSKWVQSWRQLPLKINQWANVVRWEMRTRPFLRTTEFLWQEGHTAHASKDDALDCAFQMLGIYAESAKVMLAVPTIQGFKSVSERFAGADETLTIEAMMQNGWALQSGTSHFLGQNFSTAFDVTFQNEQNEAEHVWATSWGVSTRLLGALVMTHSDDQGLVLPPSVAPYQVVIVPILGGKKKKDSDASGVEVDVLARAKELGDRLSAVGIRAHVDDRDLRPGAKFFEWERKGVPLRMEIGKRDIEQGAVMCARRVELKPAMEGQEEDAKSGKGGKGGKGGGGKGDKGGGKVNKFSIAVDFGSSGSSTVVEEASPTEHLQGFLLGYQPQASSIDEDDFALAVAEELFSMQQHLYARALQLQQGNTVKTDKYSEMVARLEQAPALIAKQRSKKVTNSAQKGAGAPAEEADFAPAYPFFVAPWAENAENEEAIQKECKATIRCYPFDQQDPSNLEGKLCFYSGQPATHMAIFARAY